MVDSWTMYRVTDILPLRQSTPRILSQVIRPQTSTLSRDLVSPNLTYLTLTGSAVGHNSVIWSGRLSQPSPKGNNLQGGYSPEGGASVR